jgi:hypothetical protein
MARKLSISVERVIGHNEVIIYLLLYWHVLSIALEKPFLGRFKNH